MYYRILNELDVNMLERCEIVNQVIMARVREIIETLGQAYGYNRGSKDMGGYALVFTSYVEYMENIEDILAFYTFWPSSPGGICSLQCSGARYVLRDHRRQILWR